MFGFVRHSWVVAAVVFALAAGPGPAIQEALAALQRGDFTAAERTLRAEVKAHPADAGALTLLGVALDGQKRFKEADEVHRRAAANAPQSADVWNNYANHLIATGDDDGARQSYLRAVVIDPSSLNANIQLARLGLKRKAGAEALGYLERLPPGQKDAPHLAGMRIEALYLANQTGEADHLTAHWLAAAQNDLAQSFSIGMALAEGGQNAKAEQFFAQALALAPSDFNVLSNLGVMAWRNGNYQRAIEALEAARRQQPENVDVLYNLACVDHAMKKTEDAVALLAHAGRLAPERSDVQKLLALATGDLGALADSAAAWDRYLKLEPNDEVARRERALVAFQMGQFDQGTAELRRFVARHPEDAVGHFELGAAENKDDPAQALAEFDRAIALKTDFAAAHSARGSLYYQMGKPEAALADLEAAAALRPDDAVSLDRLGQTYLALDRAADAVRVLRQAAALAPEDSKTQLHLARALADAGQSAESKLAMDRFRQLGPVVNKAVPGGLVDYLALTPAQRRADYRRRVEKLVGEHPEDPAAQVTWLRLLVEQGDPRRAAEIGRSLPSLKPTQALLADAGRALLEAQEYALGLDLLDKAAAAAPDSNLALDLAIAGFHASGPEEGLRRLDRVPESGRSGGYYLAKAEMMDASGDARAATLALDQAVRVSPRDPAVYRQASVFLMGKGRTEEALALSDQATEALPADRDVMLLRAVVLQAEARREEAASLLRQIENRWPEWPAGWLAEGITLGAEGKREAAIKALTTAIALGDEDLEVRQYVDTLSKGAGGKPPDLVSLVLTRASR
jgi:tetratricopeptide (TPR) repeat protein